MKITTTLCIGIFLIGNSMSHAGETHSFTSMMESGAHTLKSWTAGDHLGASKRYEEDARLLQAEARGMEHVEMKILPFLEVDAIKEAGVQQLIDRRLKEADENMKLANWHHKEAMQLLAGKEASLPAATHSQKAMATGVSQISNSSSGQSYLKYDWIEEEAILGW